MVSGEKVREKKMLILGKSRDKDYLRIALIPCQTLRRGNLKGHQHFMSIHSYVIPHQPYRLYILFNLQINPNKSKINNNQILNLKQLIQRYHKTINERYYMPNRSWTLQCVRLIL